MSLILGAQSLVETGYDVTKSCTFGPYDSGNYLNWTPSGAGTSHRTGTFSSWIKLHSDFTNTQRLWGVRYDASHNVEISYNGHFQIFANYAAATQINLRTTAYYVDPGAWYHVVLAIDTEQSVEANRVKLYINGVQNSTFSTYTTYPAEDANLLIGHGYPTSVGRNGAETGNDSDFQQAETIYVDGIQYAASDFGEFDEDSPSIWKPKDPSELTFGINGFWLDYKDSADIGNDVSGNGNDLATYGLVAADVVDDSPTNNFCAGNPNCIGTQSITVVVGSANNKMTTGGSNVHESYFSSLAASTGKWYFEAARQSGSQAFIGIQDVSQITVFTDNQNFKGNSRGYAYKENGDKCNSDTDTSYGDAYAADEIISCAFDLDNGFIYWANEGVWQASGDPTSGASGTNAAFTLTTGYLYVPACDGFNADTMSFNFGAFSPFTIATGNADGNGYGNFEYAVPSGYLALCTKNLGGA